MVPHALTTLVLLDLSLPVGYKLFVSLQYYKVLSSAVPNFIAVWQQFFLNYYFSCLETLLLLTIRN